MIGVSFVNGVLLALLPLVAIPVIIHLVNRRRAVRLQFPSLMLLRRSSERTTRRRRLKRLLLLLLRCTLVALLVLAVSKPFCGGAEKGDGAPGTPRATVLVLDDSMSMGYRDPTTGRTLLQQAVALARQHVRSRRPGERMALLLGSRADARNPSRSRQEAPRLGGEPGPILAALDQRKPTHLGTDLGRAVARAERLLKTATEQRKRILVISDLARHTLPLPKVDPSSGVVLRLLAVTPSKPAANLAVTRLEYRPQPLVGPDAHQLTATVRNFGPARASSKRLVLVVDGKAKVAATVSVPPGGAVQRSFTIRLPQAGTHTGHVELTGDSLPGDDRRHFVVRVAGTPEVLLVNGDPHRVPYRDEVFYLEKALREPGAGLRVTVVPGNGAVLPDPKGRNVVVLANCPAPSPAWIDKLKRFVGAGGGLLVTVGSEVESGAYGKALGELLPRRLRRVATAARSADGRLLRRSFGPLDRSHPVMKPLVASGFRLATASVSKLFLVEAGGGPGARILWSYEHGPPALLEGSYGRGRVMLLTTTVDRDWSDLPIRPVFLPLVQGMVRYLAGSARSALGRSLTIGRVAVVKTDQSRWSGPGGSSGTMRPGTAAGTRLFAGLGPPGVYRLGGGPDGKGGEAVALNPVRLESDLRPTESGTSGARAAAPAGVGGSAGPGGDALLLWPWLLFGLIIVFAAEAIILRYG